MSDPETHRRPWHCPGTGCPAARHDDYVGYHAGCRSKAAKAAEARYRAGEDRQTVDACGVRRRLRALAALGWPDPELAARLDCRPQAIQQWRSDRNDTARLVTAAKIDDLYRALSDFRGPSDRMRQHALRQGWLLPIWWDDDTLDDPAAAIGPTGLVFHRGPLDPNRIDELTREGLSAAEIAARLGCHATSVERVRRRQREAAGAVA